jgi:hypothetical protein
MTGKSFALACLSLPVAAGLVAIVVADELQAIAKPGRWLQHDISRPKPPVVEPVGSPPVARMPVPRDAVVLFDGSNLDAWRTDGGRSARWKVSDGFLEVAPGTGAIHTRDKFGDVQLHVEWASPSPAVGKGQDRGNSGIFLMGQFEIQVIDSYHADTYADGQAGALYGQYPPLANASRPPGEWQTYDIAFRRPRFDHAGKLLEPARFTLIHNGILVQNNEELWGGTNWLEPAPYDRRADRGPIELQDHGHKVRFRNIWLRELPDRAAPPADYSDRRKIISLTPDVLDPLTGQYLMGHDKNAKPAIVSRAEGHLLFKMPSRPKPLEMLPISATEFVLPYADAKFTFQRNTEGRVTGVLLRVGDGEQFLKVVP